MTKNEITEFDPVTYSKEELLWLLVNLDKPPVVARGNIRAVRLPALGQNKNNVIYPDGVNANAVMPLLERVQQLDQLEQHEGTKWVGKEAIKRAIQTFLDVDAKWEHDWRRTKGRAPRFPSFYSFDSKGRPHFGGPGSDSGKVKTYFGPNGERIPFALPLIAEEVIDWSPGFTEKPEEGLTVNESLHRIECFCGHTEQYKLGSRSSFNAARARISKHLRSATDDTDRHREIHTNEFGQASV